MIDFKNKPEITLKWSQTIDGHLADDDDQSQWISGIEERRYTHWLRSQNGAVLVGANTFLKDLCQLTVRDAPLNGPQPVRVILDPKGRVLERLRLKNAGPIKQALITRTRRTYILTDVFDDEGSNDALPLPNVIVIKYCLREFSNWLSGSLYLLSKKFNEIEGRELKGIMVEGGAATLSLFLACNAADRLEISVSPMILGGTKHRIQSKPLLKDAERFEFESQQILGSDILIRYRIHPTKIQRKEICI